LANQPKTSSLVGLPLQRGQKLFRIQGSSASFPGLIRSMLNDFKVL